MWKKLKPKKGEAPSGGRSPRRSRSAGSSGRQIWRGERAAFGIVWQEDLFAEGDEDNRFTIDGEAFLSAQRACSTPTCRRTACCWRSTITATKSCRRGPTDLDEAEEGRPDRLRNKSAQRSDP